MRFILAFLFVSCFMVYVPSVSAADFRSDYQVEYFLTENKNSLTTNVNFKIQITNLRSDIYVAKFAISYPKSFIIHHLKASDEAGEITPVIVNDETKTKINLEFSNPSTGKGSVNNFYLKFDQENLFKINGNVWEVILPTIERREDGVYKVIVNLPPNSDKKISISKPKPDRISDLPAGRQVIWENPTVKTIYAVFGEKQFYKTEVIYNLKNPKIIPVITEVVFPPDTLYQKIYVETINPSPDITFLDEDGNFFGRYTLGPKEAKKVIFNGIVEVSNNARSEVLPVVKTQFASQKKYLLTSQKYWQIDELEKFKSVTTVGEIYSYVTNNLKYNYKRVTKGAERLGAARILATPDQAVCTEFTDLFIALAREKGIWAREIEGYGFSSDPQLRPLSLISDVLHAWPEYYDEGKKIWIAVDPTWENTSGIDYFSSFDLNHIVFAIHGKRPDYPLPAGMYKTEDSKDVQVTATNILPKEKINLKVGANRFPARLTDREVFKAKFLLQNLGNTYLWQIPVELMAQKIELSTSKITVPVLAPGQQKELVIDLKAAPTKKPVAGLLTVNVSGRQLYSSSFKIFPYYYQLIIKLTVGIFGLSLVFFALKYAFGKRH